MKSKVSALVFLVSLFFFFPQIVKAETSPNFTIDFGKIETVFDYSTQKCELWDLPDSPARALVDADGNLQLYSAPVLTTRRFIGPNLNDVQHDCRILMSSHHNPEPRAYDSDEWITSPYTLDGNTIYGLIHTEFHGSSPNHVCKNPADTTWNCWWNSINVAKSTDKGNTFIHATPPNQNVANTSINFDPNNTLGMIGFFGPSNIIFKDGYYYATVLVHRVPSSDYQFRSCLMRTNNLDDPASWRFWNGSNYSTPARGVPDSGSCSGPNVTGTPDPHLNSIINDLHYNNYLNRYVNTISRIQTAGDPKNFVSIRVGQTLLDWAEKSFEIPTSIMPVHSNYFTFLQPGAETRNFEDIGRSPWLYFSACGGPDCSWAPGGTGNNIDLKRVRVRFNKPEDVGKYDVLDLHFNEYKGAKTLDSSFYGNDGILSGNAALQGANKYIHFGGTGGVTVNANPSLDLNNQITISGRIRTTQNPAVNTFPVIVQKQTTSKRNYGLYLITGGKLHFSIWNGTQLTGSVSNASVNDGQWHDFQINFSDATGTAQIVIDGKLDTTKAQGGSLAGSITTAPLLVGSDGFIGDVDLLTIYNYLLSTPIDSTDLNSDGKVDVSDYQLFLPNFGKTGVNIVGDIDGNGKVDIFDYNELVGNFGK